MERAVGLSWTGDSFDRLLAAHSGARRVPLATLDHCLRAHHRLLPEELCTQPPGWVGSAGAGPSARPPRAPASSYGIRSKRTFRVRPLLM